MRQSIRIRIRILVLTLALAGCSDTSDEVKRAGDPVALVTLARATTGDIAQTIPLYGQVERDGESQVALTAPVEAMVMRIAAPTGSAVAPAQLIARLSLSPGSRAQYRTAAADAKAASLALARAERLRADGLAGDADVEAARARSAAASALVASLDERNAALVLRAPHAGFIDATAASPGDLVQPGAVIATLSKTGAVRARFGIDPAQVRGLSVGMPLEIHPGDGSPPFTASIASISPVADSGTRLASVLAHIAASQGLAAGQPLSASVAIRTSRAVVSIPYAALLDDGGQPFVFVASGGVAQRRDVEIGASDGQSVAILAGVQDGEMVVVAGATGVKDGLKVRTQ